MESYIRVEGLDDFNGNFNCTHSSPSGRFRPGKIADILGLVDHVCTLLKVNTAIGWHLCCNAKFEKRY
jgi:hypothetical protein